MDISDIMSIHKLKKKIKNMSVKCDPTVLTTQSMTFSEITVALTLVTVVRREKRSLSIE